MTPLSGSARFSELVAGDVERPYSSETEFIGEAGVVAVSGEMDLYTAGRFKRDIDEAITLTSGDLVLDLSELDMIDSTALAAMLGALRRLTDEGRWLVLVVNQQYVMRLLTVSGLQTAFRIAASRQEALQKAAAWA